MKAASSNESSPDEMEAAAPDHRDPDQRTLPKAKAKTERIQSPSMAAGRDARRSSASSERAGPANRLPSVDGDSTRRAHAARRRAKSLKHVTIASTDSSTAPQQPRTTLRSSERNAHSCGGAGTRQSSQAVELDARSRTTSGSRNAHAPTISTTTPSTPAHTAASEGAPQSDLRPNPGAGSASSPSSDSGGEGINRIRPRPYICTLPPRFYGVE